MFTSEPKPRIFLLSPAFCGGKRGQQLLREGASFELARRVRSAEGAPIGEVFAFLSGLYFRGKMAYVGRFSAPPDGLPGGLVITPTRGLVPTDATIGIEVLREFSDGAVELDNPKYRGPLETHAQALAEHTADACDMVLLGSIATGKYVDILTRIFGERLLFPTDFVGRGDMSRGGLMLRAAESGVELEYAPVLGAKRHGGRPPKLEPRRWKTKEPKPEDAESS